MNAVLAHLPWAAKLDPVRFDVLAETAFNMGWTKLAFGRTLTCVASAEYAMAAEQMPASTGRYV